METGCHRALLLSSLSRIVPWTISASDRHLWYQADSTAWSLLLLRPSSVALTIVKSLALANLSPQKKTRQVIKSTLQKDLPDVRFPYSVAWMLVHRHFCEEPDGPVHGLRQICFGFRLPYLLRQKHKAYRPIGSNEKLRPFLGGRFRHVRILRRHSPALEQHLELAPFPASKPFCTRQPKSQFHHLWFWEILFLV